MKNITLAMDEKLIKAGRAYARRHNMTLNSMVRKLLAQAVAMESGDWVDEVVTLARRSKGRSSGRKWKREELYRG